MTNSSQILLRPNRRALFAGCIPPSVLAAACLGVMSFCKPDYWLGVLGFAVCGLVLVFSFVMLMGLVFLAFLPRVAIDADHLLVYLRGYHPFRVPLEVVECFFQGQGDSALNAPDTKSTNVVIRLAERATDWHARSVKRSLGEWADGYIIIRGTWCEPISETKLRSLNSELANIKRERKAQATG